MAEHRQLPASELSVCTGSPSSMGADGAKGIHPNRNWEAANNSRWALMGPKGSIRTEAGKLPNSRWALMGPKGSFRTAARKLPTKSVAGRPEFKEANQSALIQLLVSQKSVWKEHMTENHDPGYGDDRWPFTTQFVGCKPCSGYPSEQQLGSCQQNL
ncbi:hypothetical protein O6H91_10G063400 [Diphasiastrum complanatum]|uniref:Uncharacterized protein n=2 Tax=Diphasiastrum complanatum TaxID=34168 RepID=A0ACC2CGI6_DIPCM|nr:hypothetical protein O6H91_10G042700 [Diphasiastrum complanatum]KAJ7541508.1 hypothetical protein O6H91_10G063400 [Diphasiastrum complanatum]